MVTVSYHARPMYSLVWAATMANFFPEIIQNSSKYIFIKKSKISMTTKVLVLYNVLALCQII